MTGWLHWLTPDMVRALGWTLVHFLWQGAAVALLLYMFTAFCRNALTRYNAAVGALLLMAASPIVTYLLLRHEPHTNVPVSSLKEALQALQSLPDSPAAVPVSAVNKLASIDWLNWFVLAWFAGVLVFGVRALGGWVLLERLRRESVQPVAASIQRQCLRLQQRLGLSRTVRYLESHLMDSPAVVGWFRPVVLLPVTALTGLSPEQLEAVIAHELAHIKRFDCFVNLFQIAVETVLFYHPAIWWVSRCVRTERENCCDDTAVRVCGNVSDYARALTLMEAWRSTPALVLAANSGSLKSRISRLLGLRTITRSVPRAGLAGIGVLCAAGALLATTTFNVAFSDGDFAPPQASEDSRQPAEQLPAGQVPAAPAAPSARCPAPRPAAPPAAITMAIAGTQIAMALPAPAIEVTSEPGEQAQPAPAPAPERPSAGSSYIDGLHSAGFTNVTVDELIALKSQGVTPEYVREMRAAGFNPSVHDLIALKAQGVTPEYARKIRADWNDATVRDLIALRAQGVDPADAGQFRQLGMKDVTLRQLISLKAMGVSPEYVRALQSAGFSNLSAREYISAKAQGITPEFVQKVRGHGFNNLSMHQLIALKNADVF